MTAVPHQSSQNWILSLWTRVNVLQHYSYYREDCSHALRTGHLQQWTSTCFNLRVACFFGPHQTSQRGPIRQRYTWLTEDINWQPKYCPLTFPICIILNYVQNSLRRRLGSALRWYIVLADSARLLIDERLDQTRGYLLKATSVGPQEEGTIVLAC